MMSKMDVTLNGSGADLSSKRSKETKHFENLKNFNFPLEDLYKFGLKFYKEKDGSRALRISYADRVRLVALTKQVSNGPFHPDFSNSVGLLDVVGNDRRQVWQSFGDLSKEDAIEEFLKKLCDLCPQFVAFVEAQVTEREHMDNTKRELLEKEELEEALLKEKEMERRREERYSTLNKIEHQIREALNQQTAIQFKQYSKEQSPNDEAQQEVLIQQLQDQYLQQYIEQVHNQQLLHQQQQQQQLQALAKKTNHANRNLQTVMINENTEMISVLRDAKVAEAKHAEPTGLEEIELELKQKLIVDDDDDNNDDDNEKMMSSSIEAEGDSDDAIGNWWQLAGMPPLIPASIWTRSDIKEFKATMRKSPDNVIKVSSLSTATIKVPTYEDGSSIFWEFATDGFDVGFGIFFEWTLNLPTDVSVHICESSEDEEADDEDDAHQGEKIDVEKGRDSTSNKDSGAPMDEIVQVYRRDCHEEVYCGSHSYPGRGVYHLKFDNSYSLWRSKVLYYRIFYSK